jgi:hypothetical protein
MKMLDEPDLKLICDSIKKDFPNRDSTFYLLFIAVEVLRLMVDNEWVNQSLFQNDQIREKKNDEAFDYFRSATGGYEWQTRVLAFAERIYNLRRVPNIQNVINDILSGEFVSRFAELEAGTHLYGRGINFEFVLPKGKKKEDFDIIITDPFIINCEVKHKIESTYLSVSTLTKAIRSANSQVPKNTPAIIFIKVPEGWIFEPDLIKVVKNSFEPFFRRNSSHIVGIMLRWEQVDSVDERMFYWKYRLFFNEHFDTTGEVDSFIQRLEGKRTYWVSFRDIIHKNM